MIKKMTASDTNSVGKRGVPVRYRGGGCGGGGGGQSTLQKTTKV